MQPETGEREALERLGADEARLERALGEARAAAGEVVAAAHREAESLAEVARQEAEREADRLRAWAAEEVDRLSSTAGADLEALAEDLRRRVERNRALAVAHVLAAVTALPGAAAGDPTPRGTRKVYVEGGPPERSPALTR